MALLPGRQRRLGGADAAGGRGQQTHGQLDQRRLAGPIGSDQHGRWARLDGKVHTGEYRGVADPKGDVLECDG